MKSLVVATAMIASGMFAGAVRAQKPPLLPEKDVAALANELSGETAKRNLEGIARVHRMRGSQGFHAATELVAERARAYGLSDVEILQFPADGKIFYGTQRSRPPWEADSAELWEAEGLQELPCPPLSVKEQKAIERDHMGVARDCAKSIPARLIGSYEAEPVVLAEDSESADVSADLV